MNFINTWFSFSPIYARRNNAIHKDDLLLFYPINKSGYKYRGYVHQCIDIQSEYLVLRYKEINIRVKQKENVITAMPTPAFKPEEIVKFKSKGNFDNVGSIEGIEFHF